MRKEGIIKYFNKYTGEILANDDTEYIFKNEPDEDLQVGDIVTFEPLNYETPDIKQDVALLVKKKVYKNERNR
jgi:hypothetical protein